MKLLIGVANVLDVINHTAGCCLSILECRARVSQFCCCCIGLYGRLLSERGRGCGYILRARTYRTLFICCILSVNDVFPNNLDLALLGSSLR